MIGNLLSAIVYVLLGLLEFVNVDSLSWVGGYNPRLSLLSCFPEQSEELVRAMYN